MYIILSLYIYIYIYMKDCTTKATLLGSATKKNIFGCATKANAAVASANHHTPTSAKASGSRACFFISSCSRNQRLLA